MADRKVQSANRCDLRFAMSALPFGIRVLFGVLLILGAARAAMANVTTVVLPNGGECLTVGQAYTIQFSYSGADVQHVALYYRTDGQQPTHLDSSTIKHPINVPQQGTTWDWKPTSVHISETGRVWVDGHENGHASLVTWDSSNADIAVRSSCAVAATTDVAPRRMVTVPPRPAEFDTPAKVAEVLPDLDGARLRFQVPWERRAYTVRLVHLASDITRITLERKEFSLGPESIVEFRIAGLRPNTRYPDQYQIVGYDPISLAESVSSALAPPFWTLREAPEPLTLLELATSSARVAMTGPAASRGEGLSGVFFENITTVASSGWQSDPDWELTGLAPDTQYQVWAKARNGEGIETASSTPLTFRTPPAPAPPPPPPPPLAEPIRSEDETSETELDALERKIEAFAQLLAEATERIAAGIVPVPLPSLVEMPAPEPPPPPPPPPPASSSSAASSASPTETPDSRRLVRWPELPAAGTRGPARR